MRLKERFHVKTYYGPPEFILCKAGGVMLRQTRAKLLYVVEQANPIINKMLDAGFSQIKRMDGYVGFIVPYAGFENARGIVGCYCPSERPAVEPTGVEQALILRDKEVKPIRVPTERKADCDRCSMFGNNKKLYRAYGCRHNHCPFGKYERLDDE